MCVIYRNVTGVCSQKEQLGYDGQTETMETPIRALVLSLTQPAFAISISYWTRRAAPSTDN